MPFIATLTSLVFLLLAGLHAYWALGGRWALRAALPSSTDGSLPLRPTPALTAAVALALLACSGLSGARLAFGPGQLPGGLRLANGALAALLALRAVGDFRYVGLSKRVHATTFARLDTHYYTPLCALLAAAAAAALAWAR